LLIYFQLLGLEAAFGGRVQLVFFIYMQSLLVQLRMRSLAP
jgi:hypothetical protein